LFFCASFSIQYYEAAWDVIFLTPNTVGLTDTKMSISSMGLFIRLQKLKPAGVKIRKVLNSYLFNKPDEGALVYW
jgi:hypothetical protein